MLDTIIYIPTILAYAFITLLVVILCFIVIYVSHKLYISIYDNLPVVTTSIFDVNEQAEGGGGGRGFGKRPGATLKTPLDHVLLAKNESSNLYRKSKTALRIIVTLEPCHLAYVVFEVLTPDREQQRQKKPDDYIAVPSALSRLAEDSELKIILYSGKFIKYYDRLSAIQCHKPSRVTQTPPTTSQYRHPVFSVLDAVAQKALNPRSTIL